jgi:hypothetical protein
MPDHTLYERLARIEERLDQLDKIDERLDDIEKDLSRYRGLVGGVLLVITALVTFFKLFGASLKSIITQQVS